MRDSRQGGTAKRIPPFDRIENGAMIAPPGASPAVGMGSARRAGRQTGVTAGWAARRRTNTAVAVRTDRMGRPMTMGDARFACHRRRDGSAENDCGGQCQFCPHRHCRPPRAVFRAVLLKTPGGTNYFRGGLAANSELRTHMRPRGSCHSCSVACRWPSARAMVRKSKAANFSAMSV